MTESDPIQAAVYAEMSSLVQRLRTTMIPGLTFDEWMSNALDWYLTKDLNT
jgi:hypothetical protein